MELLLKQNYPVRDFIKKGARSKNNTHPVFENFVSKVTLFMPSNPVFSDADTEKLNSINECRIRIMGRCLIQAKNGTTDLCDNLAIAISSLPNARFL